jgi:Na+-translocating ferredoxin:NAD+ oxidoreductase RnfD subunit
MSNLRDILRSPKVQLLFLLAALAGVGAARNPRPALLLVQLGVAVASAVLAEWAFFGPVSPTHLHSAAVSGMLVGMILAPGASLELIWLAAVVAIASKKLMTIRPGRHIFNPAALGLAIVMLLFGNQLNWWGYSSPVIVVLGAGLILFRLRRISLVFSYFISRALAAFILGGFISLPEMLLVPNLFFAFIMVVEPKTSPAGRPAQWLFGGLCGVLATISYRWLPVLDGDLLALLAANLSRPVLERLTSR